MSNIKKVVSALFTVTFLVALTGCEAEIGSEQWCDKMKQVPKGEWSMNDAGDFTKHCLL